MAKFCPDCGTATERGLASGRERDICSCCGFVQYAKAKIGVGVPAFRGGSVLLVERNMPPDGFWTIPSGYQEENETLEMAVVREAWEETGMKVAPRGIVFLRNMMEHGAVDIYCVFLCDSNPEEEPVVRDNESIVAQFVPLNDFDKLDMEPGSRWLVETYLNLQPGMLVTRENPFDHPKLQIFMVDGAHPAWSEGAS